MNSQEMTRGNDRRVVLLIEDRRSYMATLARKLRKVSGLEVIETANGLHALTVLSERGDINAVVSDERLPGLQGTEILEEVGRRWPRIRRMLLSAFTEPEWHATRPYLVMDKRYSLPVVLGAIETLAHERDGDG